MCTCAVPSTMGSWLLLIHLESIVEFENLINHRELRVTYVVEVLFFQQFENLINYRVSDSAKSNVRS